MVLSQLFPTRFRLRPLVPLATVRALELLDILGWFLRLFCDESRSLLDFSDIVCAVDGYDFRMLLLRDYRLQAQSQWG